MYKRQAWCRPLVASLYAAQPVWRGWHRLTHFLRNKRFPQLDEVRHEGEVKRVSPTVRDLYWQTENGKGREDLLPLLVENARKCHWAGDFDNGWADWDIKLVGNRWHDLTLVTATEEQGWPRRFTRVRCHVVPTLFQLAFFAGSSIWTIAALLSGLLWAIGLGLLALLLLLIRVPLSRRRCFKAAECFVGWAAIEAKFLRTEKETRTPSGDTTPDHPTLNGAGRSEPTAEPGKNEGVLSDPCSLKSGAGGE